MYFSKRLLMYETNSSPNSNYDYGEVSQVITDKLINVNMGGSNYTLEAVAVESGYIPKVGDWVVIEWQNGNPVAKGSNGIAGGYGLNDINNPVIVAQSDLASGTINSDHIRSESIEARHIQAGSITADAISANTITSDKIAANTITGYNISANTITGQNIASNTITSDNIKVGGINGTSISANSISTVQLQANSVTSVQISANAVQTQHISANSITSQMIQVDAINATHISANSITSDEIQANAVQAQHISANSVQANMISANAVQTQHISANTITTSQIKAGAITATLISANQVNATHISANSVTATAISANAVQTQHISANTITTSQIQANAITTSLISANSITTSKIQAGAITTSLITANAITSALITANAIQTQHISANSILGYQISANQISANHIVAGAVTASAISANSITSVHISANSILANMISANQVNAQHISANSVLSNMISANQVQAQHISANSVQTQHISANSVQAQQISANSVQTQHISANTIMGYQISANQISGNHIVAGTISANQLAVGTVQQGLLGQYYTYNAGATNKFQTFKGSQIDPTINFSWGTGSPSLVGQNDYFAVRWQGFIMPPETGQYNFTIVADDTFKLTIGTTTVINSGYTSGNEATGSAISLTQGTWYPVLAEMTEGTGSATAILKWIRPSLTKEVIPSMYLSQGNTQIDGAQILTGTITASSMQVGTITAQSGILANASITTANIASGNITSALIGNGEIKTANIATGNITNALIANATIDYTKINSVDASKITVGSLNGNIITANTISGGALMAQTITGDRIMAGAIDTTQLKAGAVITSTLAAGSVTTDKIEAGAVTGDIIRAGSITAEHISTVGLDAQLIQVYNSKTGETLVGSGYLRVDGLDVGVVQSDNLLQNGLFLTSSSNYGFKRMNPTGEALLGNTVTGVGSHQIWKIDLTSGSVVKTIDIPAKKPFDVAIHPTGNYAYITVQGDDTLVQLDLSQDILTSGTKKMGVGPARAKFVGEQLEDHKHVFVLNTDPDDMHIPDSLMVIDTPPSSVNGDLYIHHEIVLGNNPYDFVVDSNLFTYVTMASQGDIVMVDSSTHDSHFWKVKNRIPISAYGTDNNHADLPSTVGLQEVTGGDASGQYNNSSSGTMSGMGGTDTPTGYGTSDGSLKTYQPHGIVQSSDANTLYVVDYANGELVVVDKHGNAPYNALTGTTAQGSYMGSNVTSTSSPASLGSSEAMGGGPGTYYVRYRIPVGDSPDFITLVNGKLFITLESGDIAVVDEQQILNEINSDNSYYGNKLSDGSYTNWNVFQPMRTVNAFTVRTIANVGIEPSIMKALGNNLYVSLSGQSQVAVVDTIGETVTKYINVGTNPKGFDFTPDGKYMYIANYGGIGNLSFVYPNGPYIGDPFMALEGGILYQGADGWTPDRSNWVYDASGNIQSKANVEFHINEPLKNEGGYAKLTAYGINSQYAQIEQDIVNVENYSNGNNTVVVTGGRLMNNLDNTVWTPREGSFISGTVHNVNIGSIVSGNTILTSANASQYSISYSTNQITFSANAVASGNWVQADYTAPNNIYFKTHNASIEIAVDNGSSPNFATSFQVDEFVPNFVAVDNRQTSSFTPTADGISTTYEGLQYSVMTNRALNTPSANITSNLTLSGGGALSYLTDGDMNISGNFVGNTSGNQYVQLDLGAIYMIGQVKVWHYSNDGRTYHNTKTQVSEDGTNWTTVFDSAVSGEYAETTSGNVITFNALPTRYVRDWTNGSTTNNINHWVEIQAFGDWQVEKGYTYPANSLQAGQQVATNGIGFVSTDISKAYVAMNVPINFTSWWWMTYIVGPQFGRIKIEMPTLMNSGHFLNQQSPYINNVAHRHIMSFPPSMMVQQDNTKGIEGGKHRVIIRQDSGKVTLDRLRFDDYQYYTRSTLAIPSQSSSTTFTRYKVVAEQSKWYQGQGRQSTEGAYDTPRKNPDSGLRDYSVPIKYRVRVLSQLSPTGNTSEAGTVYVTSAIFETGKQSTHWRRSEASDVFAGNKIETWDANHPMSTGIQSMHLADGAVRSSKILSNAIYDHHISNYARIQEHKLELNYPTHQHGYYTVSAGAGPMGTDLYIWNDNLSILDTIQGWAGTSGNYGTGNTMARGDHSHDYLPLSGGAVVTGNTTFNNGVNSYKESHFSNGTYSDPAINSSYGLKVSQGIATDKLNVNGNITVTGNITITGTVDGVDVSNLNSSYATTSGNVTNHIGSGGTAHPVATSGSAGFMGTADRSKLDGIQSSAINQTTADGRYIQLNGYTSTLNITGGAQALQLKAGGGNDHVYMGIFARSGSSVRTGWFGVGSNGSTTITLQNEVSGNINLSTVGSGVLQHNGNTVWDSANLVNPATQAWVTGNYYNQSTSDSRFLNLTGGALSGNLSITGNIIITGTVDGVDVSVLSGNVSTNSANISTLSGNIVTVSGNLNTTNSNVSALSGNVNTLSGNIVTVSGNLNTTNNNVSTLSGNIVTVSGNLNTTNSNVSTLSGNIVTVSGNLNTTNNNLSTLSGNVNTLSGNIITVSGNLNTTNSNLSALSGNVTTISGNLNTTNSNVSTLSGNIVTVSGNLNTTNSNLATVSGNLNTTNSNVATISGNLYSHIGSGGSAHAVVNSSSNGFMSYSDKNKLDGISANAINQTFADTRYYIKNQSIVGTSDNTMIGVDTGAQRLGIYKKAGYGPVMAVASGNSFNVYEMNTNDLSSNISGTSLMNQLLNMSSSNFAYLGHAIWHSGNLVDPATKTWISGNYYNSGTVDQKVASRGDVFQANANTFTNTNTFNNTGLGIKIQPSGSVASTTKLLQINDTSSNELFSVNYSGGVYVAGDLTVTGQTKYAGTTHVDGDYYISGNLYVSGNSTLGNTSTDTTTVNGTLVVSGNIQEIGSYQEVHRRPLFGIAGDLQFQTNSTTFDQIVDFYDLSTYANPTVQTGATRYYRLYTIYSDDITSSQVSGGQQSTIRISGSTATKDIVLTNTWGNVNARRDFYSPYFTDLPNGNGNLYAMLAQSGNNLGIRWVELIAYDKF